MMRSYVPFVSLEQRYSNDCSILTSPFRLTSCIVMASKSVVLAAAVVAMEKVAALPGRKLLQEPAVVVVEKAGTEVLLAEAVAHIAASEAAV